MIGTDRPTNTAATGLTAAGAKRRTRLLKAWLVLLSALLVLASVPLASGQAFAYFNFGTVQVSLGSSSVNVQTGATTRVSMTVTPASSDQTLGCGMAKCPQVCSGEGAIAAGYTCFDTNGQCTCAGRDYKTYYPQVSASSSNSAIATASISGSSIVIEGRQPGTATININASLRQYTSSSTSLQVTVVSAGSGGASSGGSTAVPSGSTSGSVVVPKTDNVSIPDEADIMESRDDQLNEQVVETVAGKVYIAECNSHLNATEELAKIKGTSDQAIFWSGSSSTHPDYSWTFHGEDIPDGIEGMSFDPTISLSKMGTGFVANIMGQAKDGVVMDFTHEGALPCEATLYVNVDASYADGQTLGLYCYDEDADAFASVMDGLSVQDGYTTFKIVHCSTWAFSTDRLDGYTQLEVNTPGAARASEGAIGQGAPSWVIPLSVGIVLVAIAGVAAFFMVSRRSHVRAGSVAHGSAAASCAMADDAQDSSGGAKKES